MEIVASILSSAVIETGRVLFGSVYFNTRNAVKFQSNLNALEKEMKDLIDLKSNLKLEIESTERDGKVPTTQVKGWLTEVEGIELEMNTMQAGMTINNGKLCGCFFNCRVQYRLSKKVVKMLMEVRRLLKAGSFPNGVAVEDHQAKPVEHIPGTSIEEQTTASKTLARTMNLLYDDMLPRIGIWGMGGVGKTTLVKNLNNKLKTDSSTHRFGVVIWATVSKELDLKRVQTQIAERLNLEVKMGESVERMAIRLYQRLQKEINFLLILDDVWETIDLDCLGVPQPEHHKGSKILLTSRSLEVCREMKTDVEVKVDVLSEEESWQLFSRSAGTVATLDHIEPFAKSVARECSGLPLAIITVGTAMRGKTIAELWKHALNELRRSVPYIKGIENKVFKHLKWSYDSLQGKNMKPCFLYCSLYPEDFSIEVSELIQCWLAEGLIDEQQNYEDSFNRGITLIENLKDSCLLEHGDREGTVKMHDVIRDVAIWIASASEDGNKSLVRSGIGLTQILEVELLESLRRVSFMCNKITRLPDSVIQCPEASTLLLQGNISLDSVPERFLQGFQAVRLLNLSGTRIKTLPLSLLQLVDLHVLLLRDCSYLEEIPPVGGLSKLLVLDFSGTRIEELPKGIEKLTGLTQLHLSRTHNLRTIQAQVVSGLSGLEVLDMTRSAYRWRVKGEVEEENLTFEDLGSLEQLVVLCIKLDSCPCLTSEHYSWINGLKRFQICIGSSAHENYLPTKHDERRVTFSDLNLSETSIEWMLNNATSLVMSHCEGLHQMLEHLAINSVACFSGLKSLTIATSRSIFRLGRGCGARFDLLPNLEELRLHHLNHLENISVLAGLLGLRFSRLKLIEVNRCPKLNYILDLRVLIPTLKNLEEIKVSFCDNLRELFLHIPIKTGAPDSVLPNLRRVELRSLPMLTTLCRPNGLFRNLEQLHVFNCECLMELPLSIQNANIIKEIRGELTWWNALVRRNRSTYFCLQQYFEPGEDIARGHQRTRYPF